MNYSAFWSRGKGENTLLVFIAKMKERKNGRERERESDFANKNRYFILISATQKIVHGSVSLSVPG